MENLDQQKNGMDDLIHQYLNGKISQQDKDELFNWIIKDPENASYFNQFCNIWMSSSIFQSSEDFNDVVAFDRLKGKISQLPDQDFSSKIKRFAFSWQQIAAVFIVTILLSSILTRVWFAPKGDAGKGNFVFEVPKGVRATITLPDSSKVILNAGSKLTCSSGFGKNNRNLNLIGEGYFKVAHNKELPFIVHAGNLNVKALGTEFDVKAYPADKEIKAILVHGSIKIIKDQEKGAEDKSVILYPKQSLTYRKADDSFNVNVPMVEEKNTPVKVNPIPKSPKIVVSKTQVDQVIYTTWKEKAWTVYAMKMEELATELERKYDVDIQFNSEMLKKISFSGTLPDLSLEQVLGAVSLIAPIEYKIVKNHVELKANEKLMPAYKKYYTDKGTE